ncbi:hypothetical protein JAAARDRAFT_322641 [Jaapia argillacea MUCL 33604]|uniref:Uncharacterized protein n=1 Tax=Jaapia argillacea MUCL 33604 TaxID=933084 RepID=A0A067Q0R7_9AGAM|nr:hypothetical protein JAAARDRAFT_322641 [Jaapia argillacea MUCL 33604]
MLLDISPSGLPSSAAAFQEFTVEEFSAFTTSSAARANVIRHTRLVEMSWCGGSYHKYLILAFKNTNGDTLYVRVERDFYPRSWKGVASIVKPDVRNCKDTVRVSQHRISLEDKGSNLEKWTLRFDEETQNSAISLVDLVRLLKSIRTCAPGYSLPTTNCQWFAITIWSAFANTAQSSCVSSEGRVEQSKMVTLRLRAMVATASAREATNVLGWAGLVDACALGAAPAGAIPFGLLVCTGFLVLGVTSSVQRQLTANVLRAFETIK